MSYNGWKNYETWCVHLHLTNTEWTQRICEEMAKGARENYTGTEVWTAEQHRKFSLADDIKEFVEERISEGRVELSEHERFDFSRHLIGDLINSALAEVSWAEIANAFLGE